MATAYASHAPWWAHPNRPTLPPRTSKKSIPSENPKRPAWRIDHHHRALASISHTRARWVGGCTPGDLSPARSQSGQKRSYAENPDRSAHSGARHMAHLISKKLRRVPGGGRRWAQGWGRRRLWRASAPISSVPGRPIFSPEQWTGVFKPADTQAVENGKDPPRSDSPSAPRHFSLPTQSLASTGLSRTAVPTTQQKSSPAPRNARKAGVNVFGSYPPPRNAGRERQVITDRSGPTLAQIKMSKRVAG